MQNEKYYITTAIAYTSRKPHIGNSYEIVLTDALARLKRLQGRDVRFLTGTDEHGQKIEELAREEGIEPKQLVDSVAGQVRDICDKLDISYDDFIRTTDERHKCVVQKIFQKLYDQGDIYKSAYEGWYCVPDESFFTDAQLVDGKCPECGREVKRASEEAYFFKMSNYQDRLQKHLDENPDFIVPESRKREMVNNFLKPGLQDLCVSRSSFSWGIPVSFDDKHVIYVWIDALTNYISALDYDAENPGELFLRYWPAEAHIIGKDILRFHTIYWPILLMALGIELPKQIYGHPWLLSGEDKMSKSRGNVIYADELAERIGVDGVRWYLLCEMPYAQDGTVSYARIFERYNADLANVLGNLVQRTLAMTHKYFGGTSPKERLSSDVDVALFEKAKLAKESMQAHMDTFHCADAAEQVLQLAKHANKYIDECEPWVLGKDETQKERLAAVLGTLLECIRHLGVLLSPFMPKTSEEIFCQLSCPKERQTLESLDECISYDGGVQKPQPLFARLDAEALLAEIEAEIEAKVAKQEAAEKAKAGIEAEVMPDITFDDFLKMQLLVAEIRRCTPVKKSKKLLLLTVFDGTRERQVVSGIAPWYTAEELTGRKVVLVANLAPATLCGQLSEGMILASDGAEGEAQVLFLPETAVPGARVR